MSFFKAWILIGFYSIACLGIGVIALQLLSKIFHVKSQKSQNVLITYSSCMIVGVALLGALWTFITLLGIFAPAIIFLIILPPFLYALWQFFIERAVIKNDIKEILVNIHKSSWLYKLIGFSVIYFIFVIISNNLIVAPNDGSAYYFALPKVISSSHTLKPLPGFYFNSFPSEAIMALGLHGELHMAALFSLGAGQYSRFFDVPLLITSLLTLLGFLSMAGVRTKGLFIATLLFFSTSAVTNVTAIGKVDIYGITFTLGSIYFAGKYFCYMEKDAISLSGLLIGTAITTKFSYLVNLFPAIIFLLLWHSLFSPLLLKKKQFFLQFKKHVDEIKPIIFIFSGFLILSLLPYFTKNQVILGFFAEPFFLPKDILSSISNLFPSNVVKKIIIVYPFSLSFFDIQSNPGNFPPFILAFLPNLFFARKSIRLDNLDAISFISGLIGIILWAIFFPGVILVRYIFAALIMLLPLVLRATEVVLNTLEFLPLQVTINGCLLIATTFGLINPAFFYVQIDKMYQAAIKGNPQCTFPQCEQDQAINRDSNKGDRVLNLSDFRYWLRADLIQCSASTDETKTILSVNKSDYWETIYRYGIKYVSLNLTTKGLEDPISWSKPDWIHVDQVYRHDDMIVYRLTAVIPPYSPAKQCTQLRPPSWEILQN